MCLQASFIAPVPELTARVARAAFPKGNLYLRMRDEFGTFFTDAQFADLFSTRGQPAEVPCRLALVTLFQFFENLSDRQAAEAVRARLLEGSAEARLLETLLTLFTERGLFKVRGRQRTDSTHVYAAVHALNRLETVGETLRAALNAVAEVAPQWLAAHTPADWFDRYSKRMDVYRLPRDKEQRYAAVQTGEDGFCFFALLNSEQASSGLASLSAVQTLRQVWIQQFRREGEKVVWRSETELPPSALMIRSAYDVQARLSVKRETQWTGYKVHLTETCDSNTPHLITQVHTTPATTADSTETPHIQEALAQANRLPAQHLVDEGYTEAEYLVSSQHKHHVELLGPVAINPSWQAQEGKGYDVASFQIDWEKRCAICPAGKQSCKWARTRNARGSHFILVTFAPADCQICPRQPQCTRASVTGRSLYLHPQPAYQALHAARQSQQTPAFRAAYAARAGIEGTLSQGIRACGLRSSRYVGLAKTHLQNLMIAAAVKPREKVALPNL